MTTRLGLIGASSAVDLPMSTDLNEVPFCLKKLVRTIIRSFYSREHSLIMDLLVRNTIMKEDDLCERLHFEKKQLRQHLHTLKLDHFIKSKLQLETDAEGKIVAKIIHYFIDYKVFVNIVKYRLDQMQRRLEAEQRQSSSRALFRCLACGCSYTDLEVDRLIDAVLGKLVCTYCRADVKEEEDNAQRSDARALVAKFQQQVRTPLDSVLKECDNVHLSSSVLEPEFRALEPLSGSSDGNAGLRDSRSANALFNDAPPLSTTESTVTIVLGGSVGANANLPKERPVWMSESTIVDSGVGAGLGELDRGISGDMTQTLAPGRVPTHDNGSSSIPETTTTTTSSASHQSATSTSNNGGSNANPSTSDIMQLLRVHERRGLGSHGPKSAFNRPTPSSTVSKTAALKNGVSSQRPDPPIMETAAPPKNPLPTYMVTLNGTTTPFAEISPAMIKVMTASEREEYIQVGTRLYSETVVD